MSRNGPFVEQARVIYALILRDTRTLFGRTWFGFAIMILWPLTHALMLMTGYMIAHRVAPYGTEISVFVGTGVLPYVLCLYPARMIMLCLVQNQPLLTFPVVKPFDVILARGVLQTIVAFWVVSIFCLIMFAVDIVSEVDFVPNRLEEAMAAILATIYLGFSMGFFSAVLYKLTRVWQAVQVGILILMYAAGGAFFIPSALPEWIRDIIWFNPMLHAIEWLRSAYYEGYGDEMLNRGYLLGYASLMLFLGLLLERGVRGKLQQIY